MQKGRIYQELSFLFVGLLLWLFPATNVFSQCGSIITITGCGSSNSQSFSGGGTGAWASNACYTSPGLEQIYSFTPSVTGAYSLQVTAASGYVDYLWKDASGGCSSSGWTCIDYINAIGTYGSMSWTAGTTYYLLLDDENTTIGTHTFYINCISDPCASITTISGCGSSYAQSFAGGSGGAWASNACYTSPGLEKIYSFTAPTTGTYSLQVTAASGYIDYNWKAASGGCSNSGWTCIGYISATGTYGSMSWTAGTTYYILLDDENTSTGTHTFYINCPAGDPCSSVINIAGCGSGNSKTFTGGGFGAWSSNGCYSSATGSEQIYSFTPSVSGNYSIQVTAASGYVDYNWKAASGGCISTGWTCIDDIYTTGTYGSMSWTAGTTYYILLDDENSTTGTHTFYINCISDPCASITTISGCGSSYPQSFSGGGAGAWASNPCFSSPGSEKIFSFTAPATGTYSIQVTAASGYMDYNWKASSGGCSNLDWTCISDVNAAGTYGTFSWTGGVTYYILLDDEDGTAGTHTFYVNCAAADPCASTTTIPACGSANSQTYSNTGTGAWFTSTYNDCGYYTEGIEKIYSFTPATSDNYTIEISAASGEYVDYLYQSGSCSSSGWDCISDMNSTGTVGTVALTAGTTYYFLLDPEGTAATSHTFYIGCPSPGPCASITTISGCGSGYTQTYNPSGSSAWISTAECGYSTPGVEKIYQFTPAQTGTYRIRTTVTTGGYVDYLYKEASGGCTTTGWTCIEDITSAGTFGSFDLTAGVTYYFLLDAEGTGSYNHQFYLTCPEMIVPSTSNNSYTTCSGILYDNGGSDDDYTNSCTGYTVIYPTLAGNMIQIAGTTSGETCCDYLRIYNGVGTGGTLLGTYYMGNPVPLTTSTHGTGALTVQFVSDGGVVGSGFELTINCYVPCAVPAGTASATPATVPVCTNTSLTLTGYGGSIQWQASSDNINWSNIPGATTTPYSVSVGGTMYYRAAVTSGCTSYSNAVTVTVSGGTTGVYYVNDASLSGDVFCTAAGSSANSGTSPCSPKSNIQDIVDHYDLEPGNIVYIDAGTYTMGCDLDGDDQGSAAGDVTFQGAGKTLTIITAPAADDNFNLTGMQYTVIKDMKLISTQPSNYNYRIEEGTQHHLVNCHLVHSGNTNVYMVSNGGSIDIDENSVAYCTIENSSSTGCNIWFDGDADNDTVRNCIITSTGTGGAKAVYFTDRVTGLSYMWPTTVRMYSNLITADDYGIYANTLSGNTMEEFDIHDNTIVITSKDKADGAALWFNDHGTSSSYVSKIYRNKIRGGKNGIYLTDEVNYCHFYNNYISGCDIGIYVDDDYSADNDLQHNSFYTAQQCAYFNGDSKADWNVRNNIFYCYGGTAYECLYAEDASSTFVTCDYNVYYAPGGANIAEYSGAKALYSTLAAWQGVDHHDGTGNGDLNSFYTDPNYQAAASGDLDLVGNYQTGLMLGTITSDIYLTARTHPTIGAWEEGSLLPVVLARFFGKCEDNSVVLNWMTTSEINNDYFTLERSQDALEWTPIAKVSGTGNSSHPVWYNYTDVTFTGITYYRLKQTDKNGSYVYSEMIAVSCDNDNTLSNDFLVVSPNPCAAGQDLSVTYCCTDPGKSIRLVIHDTFGREVYASEQVSDEKGAVFEKINHNHAFSSGIYYVLCFTGDKVLTEKIVLN